MDWNGRF